MRVPVDSGQLVQCPAQIFYDVIRIFNTHTETKYPFPHQPPVFFFLSHGIADFGCDNMFAGIQQGKESGSDSSHSAGRNNADLSTFGHSLENPLGVRVVWLVCALSCLIGLLVFIPYQVGDTAAETQDLMERKQLNSGL